MSDSSNYSQNQIIDVEKGERSPADSRDGRTLGRNLTPGGHLLDDTQPAFPVYHRKFANPAPLGLSGFALTTFVLSMINLNVRGITIPAIVVGSCLFYGGLIQLLVGMWEIAAGNTLAATLFTSYGGFWLSFGYFLAPWSGVESAYSEAPEELASALAIYLFGWMIFTCIMTVASLRSSIALTSLLFLVAVVFLLLGLGQLYPLITALPHAGGILGLLASFNAWYIAAAGLLTPETSYFVLPVGDRTRRS